jgi:hypothetical protein
MCIVVKNVFWRNTLYFVYYFGELKYLSDFCC